MPLTSASGPAVARLLLRGVAGVSLVAWLSLGAQALPLFGALGISPIAARLDGARAQVSAWEAPTWLWLSASDDALLGGAFFGGAACLLALFGLWPRVCLGLSGALYLGYVLAGDALLAFQWDNLLIEASVLALLTPQDRPAPWVHLAWRTLLFKLYFLSAVAKAQSPIGDWWDGSAMAHYYETAPLPTPLAWWAHQLPGAWHSFESWWALFFEGVIAWGVFGPRLTRRVALVAFTSFQIVNMATANYGFFCWFALVISAVLLDEEDVARWGASARSRLGLGPAPAAKASPPWQLPVGALYVGLSILLALHRFTPLEPAPRLAERVARLRLVNNYHLFAQITTRRIEPSFEVKDREGWRVIELPYKAGDPDRPLSVVHPHQPRLDFMLWFYGLGYQRGAPGYVVGALRGLCHHPEAVQPLFETPLPTEAEAVRLRFWEHRFTEPGEPGWWRRVLVDEGVEIPCVDLPHTSSPPL
ncbi:lipase maturation factor family protein [Myxococcota bacterium]|nr:lipase maturation factor family protein [Myxococcota bacterium]